MHNITLYSVAFPFIQFLLNDKSQIKQYVIEKRPYVNGFDVTL